MRKLVCTCVCVSAYKVCLFVWFSGERCKGRQGQIPLGEMKRAQGMSLPLSVCVFKCDRGGMWDESQPMNPELTFSSPQAVRGCTHTLMGLLHMHAYSKPGLLAGRQVNHLHGIYLTISTVISNCRCHPLSEPFPFKCALVYFVSVFSDAK